MTNQEAAKILRTENLGDSEQMELAKQMGAKALDRLTPKKPYMKALEGFDPEVASELACPTCGSPVTNYWVRGAKPAHCQFCGQAIDWEGGDGVKKMKLKPCPNCSLSGRKLWVCRVMVDGTWSCKLGKYYIECPSCHWCGKTKVFLWRAKRAWNRRRKA